MPIFRALRDAAARDGREVVFAQVWQLMDLPPWAEPGWRGQMLRRTLYEAGVHLVDFLMALFGERPVSVTASVSTCGVRESESDAVALCTLEFSRGRLAQIIQNRLCKGETQYFEVRAETIDASLRASFGGRARITAGLHRSTRPHLRVDYGVSGMAWEEIGQSARPLGAQPEGTRHDRDAKRVRAHARGLRARHASARHWRGWRATCWRSSPPPIIRRRPDGASSWIAMR